MVFQSIDVGYSQSLGGVKQQESVDQIAELRADSEGMELILSEGFAVGEGASNQIVDQYSQRPIIRRSGDGFPSIFLRRVERRNADRVGWLSLRMQPREIGELWVSFGIDNDILAVDSSVYYAQTMQFLEGQYDPSNHKPEVDFKIGAEVLSIRWIIQESVEMDVVLELEIEVEGVLVLVEELAADYEVRPVIRGDHVLYGHCSFEFEGVQTFLDDLFYDAGMVLIRLVDQSCREVL